MACIHFQNQINANNAAISALTEDIKIHNDNIKKYKESKDNANSLIQCADCMLEKFKSGGVYASNVILDGKPADNGVCNINYNSVLEQKNESENIKNSCEKSIEEEQNARDACKSMIEALRSWNSANAGSVCWDCTPKYESKKSK